MKQDSRRHHYYVEEAKGVMNLLDKIRRQDVVEEGVASRRHSNKRY